MRSRAQATGKTLDHEAAMVAAEMLLKVRSCYGPWTYVIDNSQLSPAETALAIYQAVDHGFGRL